jgi:hypothetical protein
VKEKKDILYLLKEGDNVKASTLLKYNIIKNCDGTHDEYMNISKYFCNFKEPLCI